jgi:hypothetical protein
LREEHRLRISVNRELRRIFGPNRDEIVGEDCIMTSFRIKTALCLLPRLYAATMHRAPLTYVQAFLSWWAAVTALVPMFGDDPGDKDSLDEG